MDAGAEPLGRSFYRRDTAIVARELLGKLVVRRLGQQVLTGVIVERTALPLQLDFHLGLDDQHFERVAHLSGRKGPVDDPAAQKLLDALLHQPEALATRAFSAGG